VGGDRIGGDYAAELGARLDRIDERLAALEKKRIAK
jgi:hypothetical protein